MLCDNSRIRPLQNYMVRYVCARRNLTVADWGSGWFQKKWVWELPANLNLRWVRPSICFPSLHAHWISLAAREGRVTDDEASRASPLVCICLLAHSACSHTPSACSCTLARCYYPMLQPNAPPNACITHSRSPHSSIFWLSLLKTIIAAPLREKTEIEPGTIPR